MRKISVRFAAGALALGLLSGCASTEADTTPAASATADPDAVVSIEMPDLGPSPAPDDLTDEQREALRLERQDADWQFLLGQYPDAVRPTDRFENYTDADDLRDAQNDCYVSSGLEIDGFTIDVSGEQFPGSPITTNSVEAIAAFDCRSRVASFHPPLNDDQLGYLYDYLTKFLGPCYEANGIENPAPPARDEFIAQWPNQHWYPSVGELTGSERAKPIYAACPFPL